MEEKAPDVGTWFTVASLRLRRTELARERHPGGRRSVKPRCLVHGLRAGYRAKGCTAAPRQLHLRPKSLGSLRRALLVKISLERKDFPRNAGMVFIKHRAAQVVGEPL